MDRLGEVRRSAAACGASGVPVSRLRVVPVAAVVTIAGLVAACTSTSDGTESGHGGVERSVEQESALVDGDVTVDEYRAGFRRFEACIEAEGYMLGNVEVGDVLIDYGVPDAAVQSGVDEKCYVKEYELVDTEWQLKNEDSSYTAEVVAQCLAEHGITPAETLAEKWDQLEAAGVEFEECM